MNKKSSVTDSLFVSLGLDTSTAVRMFLTAAIQTGGLPFEVKRPKPSRELLMAMKEAKQIAHDPSVKGYRDVKALFAALDKEAADDLI